MLKKNVMGSNIAKTSVNRDATHSAKKAMYSGEVLKALTDFGKQHYNCKPGVGTNLGAAVYNQLRARSGSPQDWENRKLIKQLNGTMTVVWKQTLASLGEMKDECFQPWYPLKLTKAKATKSDQQVKVVGSRGLAIETCTKDIERIDESKKRFFVNARNRRASWVSSGGIFDNDFAQKVRNSVLNLDKCDATIELPTTGQLQPLKCIQVASPKVVDFLYLALCDTARCLDNALGADNWCVTWGTLLAACRSPSGGLIPWDNDADILAVPEDYMHFMQEVLPTIEFHFNLLGYGVHSGAEGWLKIFPTKVANLGEMEQRQECRHRIREMSKRDKLKLSWGASAKMATELWEKTSSGSMMDLQFVGNNTVDIFVAKRGGGGVIHADWGPIDKSFIFPTQPVSFGPLVVPGPAEMNGLLKKWYGPNWRTPMYRHPISHRMVLLELKAPFPKELLPNKTVLKVLKVICKVTKRKLRRQCPGCHKTKSKATETSEAKARQCGSKGKAKPRAPSTKVNCRKQ